MKTIDDSARPLTAEEQVVLDQWAEWFTQQVDQGMCSHIFSTDFQEGDSKREIYSSADGN